MKGFLKKLVTCCLIGVLATSIIGCSNDTEDTTQDQEVKESPKATKKDSSKESKKEEKISIDVAVNFGIDNQITIGLEEVAKGFEEETGIEANIISLPDYEAVMKAKMAANELPDMWSTHGWSVLRYSEYLTPLEDQEWAKVLHPAIEPVITDEAGHIYVLPIDVDVAGIAYNKDVVEQAGVDVDSITTWDNFQKACASIKEKTDAAPISIGGKDNWTIGNFLDWVGPAVMLTNTQDYDQQLLDGNFNSDGWNEVNTLFKDMYEAGYFNADALTGTYSDVARMLGTGETAFGLFGNYVISEALSYNPDANLGFMPVPAYYSEDTPFLISGERTTLGVWKDTENREACLQFLSYIARPEVMSQLATISGVPAGLTTADSDTGILKEDYVKYQDVSSVPYFDRVYLPSGMWDTMCATGSALIAGEMTVEEATAKMKEDFDKLYN